MDKVIHNLIRNSNEWYDQSRVFNSIRGRAINNSYTNIFHYNAMTTPRVDFNPNDQRVCNIVEVTFVALSLRQAAYLIRIFFAIVKEVLIHREY